MNALSIDSWIGGDPHGDFYTIIPEGRDDQECLQTIVHNWNTKLAHISQKVSILPSNHSTTRLLLTFKELL